MRLLSLKLERYGCFTDKELVFRPGASLHLVFGENEAGKSTALSAITDLLFGIESRTAYDFQHPGQMSLGGTIVAEDGQEFSFKRRKGTKNTLLGVNGKPIAEDSLDRYLHGLTRNVFSNAFGMNAESLREGAAEMLTSGGDSGVSLFAAAAGVRGLAELQKALAEKSDRIFAPRRSRDRLFYQALARFESAKDDLRRLELKERDLRELRKSIEESKEKLEDLRKKRNSLLSEREQLQRDKDTSPHLIVPFLFHTRNGKPLGSSCILRRHLHPALKNLGFINPFNGTHKAGHHAFRRFRNTHLRNRTECPEGLRKFWMGHADESMSDLYDKIKEDVEFRRKWAEKCGFGFELSSVVPNVPKIEEKDEARKAA